MGNHDVGRVMAAAADAFFAGHPKDPLRVEALAILDAAASRFRGSDAEFDDELDTWTPLSRLVAIAFDATPEETASLKGEGDESDENTGMKWYDGPRTRFSERYNFC